MGLVTEIKESLELNDELMEVLTGGIHVGVEEINRQLAPEAFDENGEILPCALVKQGVEYATGPYERSVRSTIIFYFYDQQGLENIESALGMVFDLLNEKQTGDGVWNIEYVNSVYNQRDTALDCALSVLRFNAVRQR